MSLFNSRISIEPVYVVSRVQIFKNALAVPLLFEPSVHRESGFLILSQAPTGRTRSASRDGLTRCPRMKDENEHWRRECDRNPNRALKKQANSDQRNFAYHSHIKSKVRKISRSHWTFEGDGACNDRLRFLLRVVSAALIYSKMSGIRRAPSLARLAKRR